MRGNTPKVFDVMTDVRKSQSSQVVSSLKKYGENTMIQIVDNSKRGLMQRILKKRMYKVNKTNNYLGYVGMGAKHDGREGKDEVGRYTRVVRGGYRNGAMQRALYVQGHVAYVVPPAYAVQIAGAVAGGVHIVNAPPGLGNLQGHFWNGQFYVGGRVYNNMDNQLPPGVLYQEWDVLPRQQGVWRGLERLVTGVGTSYYTPNHYADFYQV